jgi:hypothetical protein
MIDQSVREEEDTKAKEKAEAYRLMMQSWSFKDFMEYVKSLKEGAIKSIYLLNDERASEAQFGRLRGILETVVKIERELDFIVNFGRKP